MYQIRNRIDGKVYVGGAYKSFALRFKIHHRDLRANRHNNRHLQNAWWKYGPSAFSFEIVQRCPQGEVEERETFWINEFRATQREYGYNKSPYAGSPLGVKHSEEYGQAVSERNKKRGEATRYKLGASWRGKKQSEEFIRKRVQPLIGRKRPKVVVDKITALLRGKKRTGEALANITAANRLIAIKRRKNVAGK